MGGQEPASIHTGGMKLLSSGREVVPALGPSWAACVSMRIFLSRAAVSDSPYPFNLPQARHCMRWASMP